MEWWEEREKLVLRALFCLTLYRLSSLGPSERLNHKRVQSLGDILFSPSLNTLYHIPDPYNFSSCIYNSSQPKRGAWVYLLALCVINIMNISFPLSCCSSWEWKGNLRGKLTHFSPAARSAVHLPHVPSAGVTQGNSETHTHTQKKKWQECWGGARISPILPLNQHYVHCCTLLWHTGCILRQDVARHNSISGTGRKLPHPTLPKVSAWHKLVSQLTQASVRKIFIKFNCFIFAWMGWERMGSRCAPLT